MPGRRWLRAFRTPLGVTAALLMGVVLGLALVGPILWGEQAEAIDTSQMLAGPSPEHWAGTDNLGRDLVARVLVATRLSVILALSATAVAVGVGLALGAGPMLVGRRVGRLISGAVNIAVAFPGLLLALFFAVIFGVGAVGAVLAIGLAGAPAFARLCQTLVASVGDRDFVTAARIAGVSRGRLLVRHVLPNIGEPLVVNATIGAGGALLAFAGLSFLGLGVQAPAYDWGRLLQDGLTGIYLQPVGALAPGLAIVVAGLAFNLFGEAIAKGFGISMADGGTATEPSSSRAALTVGSADGGSPLDIAEAPAADHGEPELAGRTRGEPVLEVRGLSVTFPTSQGPVRPVRGVSFRVERGEAVGVVGESGSGKSLTALAVAQLIEEPGSVAATRLRLLGTDLLSGSERSLRHLLGTSLSMVFQDPGTSFNPTRRVGGQLAEVGRYHLGMSRAQASARAIDRLRAVHVPAPERRAGQYPHEFSGGMRQRAMIGMGLMGSPALIIADEPTTALDVTIQKQVLQLLQSIREADGVALLLISHDVAVVRQVCDRVLVMYAGRIVEDLPAADLATRSRHPYTRALAAAVPDMDSDLHRPLAVIPGRPVEPSEVPIGCAYAARCPLADQRCLDEDPALLPDGNGRRVACWHAGEPIDLASTEALTLVDEAPGPGWPVSTSTAAAP
jgi:oligopeptide/dipeptide ABC transporter ATP-binding protein